MLIDLKKCASGPLEVRQRFDLGPTFASYPEIETIAPVEADLRITVAGANRYLVAGGFTTEVSAYCVRCLEPFPVGLQGRFQLVFLPESARSRPLPGDTEMQTEEIDTCYYGEDQIAVLPVLEEQINLAFPMRFVCRESCQGLCTSCGANLNQSPCGCRRSSPDPRLEMPKTLLD